MAAATCVRRETRGEQKKKKKMPWRLVVRELCDWMIMRFNTLRFFVFFNVGPLGTEAHYISSEPIIKFSTFHQRSLVDGSKKKAVIGYQNTYIHMYF